jgi:methionyl-tRNA formyltransferase
MRVVFLGNAEWSVPSLESLAASSHEIALVITRVPRPAGRKRKLSATAVAVAAHRLGLPLLETESAKSGPAFDALAGASPDALAVVAYGEILPAAVLGLARVASVNLHFSLLPKLRGAAPVQRAILEGLDTTGLTTIRMDEGMDTGPVLLQASEPISVDDDAGSLGSRLAVIGGRLLVETLDGIQEGTIEERPQDESAATFAPKLKPQDRRIVWERSASEVLRQIRAMAPEPGAETSLRGRTLKVYRASDASDAVASEGDGDPGEIVVASAETLAVATAHLPVVLEEVQPEGRRRMSGAEFARGYRPRLGERLG